MYIKNRSASALYKLFIGIVALVGFWVSLLSFGLSAWRLFSTYAMLLTALYLLLSALIIALSKKRNPGRIPCPMLDGMLIVSLTLLCVSTIVCRLQNVAIPSANGWHASLIYFVVPFLVLSDWALFARKGRWRMIDPFYWVSPAVIYTSLILLTVDFVPQDSSFRYPLPFLDYSSFGVIEMVEWFIVIGVLSLIYGYALVAIDFIASGKVSRYIVLPHFKTIVEEEPVHEQPIEQAEPSAERIEVKLERMESPKTQSNQKTATNTKPKLKSQSTGAKVQDVKPSVACSKQSHAPQSAKTSKAKIAPKTQPTQNLHQDIVRNSDGIKLSNSKAKRSSNASKNTTQHAEAKVASAKTTEQATNNGEKATLDNSAGKAAPSDSATTKTTPKIRKF